MTTGNAILLAVSEIFHSVQGEGPSAGKRASFLRLALCNLKCTWCDTKYTWDWEQYNKHEEISLLWPSDAAEKINVVPESLLVITGGEPLLQQKGLLHLLPLLQHERIEIETNGTIKPLPELMVSDSKIHFNVSPKLRNNGQTASERLNPVALFILSERARSVFKFVVENETDLLEVDELVFLYSISKERVWIMPQGITEEEVSWRAKSIAQAVMERQYNLTLREHLTLFGSKRGT